MKPHIFFYSPKTFEEWDYTSPDTTGIGGSETCQIELALGFAKRGYRVMSYSMTPNKRSSYYGGVQWNNIEEVNFNQDGIWILSRCPNVMDNFSPSPRREAWLICQDEDYDPKDLPTNYYSWNEERREKLGKIIALCPEQYKNLYNKYPDIRGKLALGSNGIRTNIIKEIIENNTIERNLHKTIYLSSPLRGLKEALFIINRAREDVTDLELSVCYGFQNVEKVLEVRGVREKYEELQKSLSRYSSFVSHKKRLSQRELYKEILSSGIFLYPTNVFETGCIASMEAMALGAFPLTSRLGALSTNIQYGELIDGDVEDKLILLRFVNSLKKWIHNPPSFQEREEMMMWAQGQFNWEKVVDRYEGWIEEWQ